MNKIISYLVSQPSENQLQYALLIMRVSIGILTMFHGMPKLMGGISGWRELGVTFMYPMGIRFLPIFWGFMGAITEFLGGILLALGLVSRIASIFLIVMMIIATIWHIKKGDSFNYYSFPLSLIFVYLFFVIVGSGKISIDNYLS